MKDLKVKTKLGIIIWLVVILVAGGWSHLFAGYHQQSV